MWLINLQCFPMRVVITHEWIYFVDGENWTLKEAKFTLGPNMQQHYIWKHFFSLMIQSIRLD